MQSRAPIGLLSLVRLLLCACLVVVAVAGSFGCSKELASLQCPTKQTGLKGGQLKCRRCKKSVQTLLAEKEEQATEPSNAATCEVNIYEYEHGDPNYSEEAGEHLETCFTAGLMLYDGAVECARPGGANAAGAIQYCLGGDTSFRTCLCSQWIGSDHIKAMQPCFLTGAPRLDTQWKCPSSKDRRQMQYDAKQRPPAGKRKPGTKNRPGNKKGGGKSGNRRAAAAAADDASSNNDAGGGGDGSGDDYTEEDVFPDPADQFSPILDDDGVSWYLDIYERTILVDTKTNEILYYTPFYLYPAPSFDDFFAVPGESDVKLMRRCWFYPVSNSVWCWQWYIYPDEYDYWGYVPDDTDGSSPHASSTDRGATVGAATGYTTVPQTYSSESYSTAGPAPTRQKVAGDASPTGSDAAAASETTQGSDAAAGSATTQGSDAAAGSATTQGSDASASTKGSAGQTTPGSASSTQGSAGGSNQGSSAAATYPHGTKSWLSAISLLAVMYNVL